MERWEKPGNEIGREAKEKELSSASSDSCTAMTRHAPTEQKGGDLKGGAYKKIDGAKNETKGRKQDCTTWERMWKPRQHWKFTSVYKHDSYVTYGYHSNSAEIHLLSKK